MKNQLKRVYVGFGANLGDPLATYSRAKVILESKLGPLIKESWVYESAALTLAGTQSQTNYFNTALVFETLCSPREVLECLLETEQLFKRSRNEALRWAPRPIDLDILFYEDAVICEPGLSIPHPELHKRDFVLCPLVDVDPGLVHPELGETVATLEASLVDRGYSRLIIRRFEIKSVLQSDAEVAHCEPEDRGSLRAEQPL